MKLRTILRDDISGLSLTQDGNDPPRFYVQWRQKRDLIAIGDESLARQRFSIWCEKGIERIANRHRAGQQRRFASASSKAHQGAARVLVES